MLGYLYLYKPEPQRPIWVDAICINQSDAEEKAVQIPLMHRIYSSAQTVLVWPGRLDKIALDCAGGLQEVPLPWDSDLAADVIRQRWPLRFSRKWSLFWQGLLQLLNLDWFERLWTFQEVVLAKEAILFCGRTWIDLDNLLRFTLKIYADPEHPFGKSRSLDHRIIKQCSCIVSSRYLGRRSASTLPSLLDSLRHRRFTEEVDRIWAIFGLLDETMRLRLSPLIDYTENARREPWRTFIACMKHVASESRNLWILHIPRAQLPKHLHLPSWCPDLRGRGNVHECLDDFWLLSDRGSLTAIFTNGEREDSSEARRRGTDLHKNKLVTISETDDYLSVLGFEVDTIVEIVEDERLIGAWHYTTDYYSSQDNYQEENPTHVAAMAWLKNGIELARRVLRQQSDEEAASSIPDEFFMALWFNKSVSQVGKCASVDAFNALLNCDYNMTTMEGVHKERILQAH